ncbi:MAG TPA: EamA family transporter [Candidatus Eisenbacteria bacterium]|nr:EamA family transporter [Candidatus Eisenbacteria bacterium]
MSVPVAATGIDRLGLAAFVGVVLFGGANSIGVKQTVQELAPFWGGALRFVVAGVILLVIAALTRRSFPRGRSLTGAVLYGAIGFAASFGLAYTALRDTPAGTAQVLIALVPLLTFGLAILQRQERFRAEGLIGGLVALTGIAIVFVDQLGANVPIVSLIFLVLAAACIAESGVLIKWVPRSDPIATNGIAMTVGAALLLGASLVAGEPRVLPVREATWAAIGYLVVFGSVVMFTLYLFTLERWTASAASYSTLLLPLVTVSLAAILTQEQVSPSFLVGGAVVLVGVYIGAFLRRPHRSSASSMPECYPVDACGQALVPAERSAAT